MKKDLWCSTEAQVMFMRVFSDRQKKQRVLPFIQKAIDDAVALGADTINMSLGSSTVLRSMQVQISLTPSNQARAKGFVSVLISAK